VDRAGAKGIKKITGTDPGHSKACCLASGRLLGGQVDQLGWADSLMQQRGAARTNDDKWGQIC
jgi:hypothetical protein